MIAELETGTRRSTHNRWTTLPDEARVRRTVDALQANGMTVLRARDAAEAKSVVVSLIPEGAQVHHGASKTLEVTGIADALEHSGRFDPVGARTRAMDRVTQADEIRRLSSAPDVMLGSVHAVTENGSLIAASMGGGQLGPYAGGAGRVILVVGTQKIVADLDEGLQRVYDHALPLEDARAQEAYGISSAVNKLLIINREVRPGRMTVVLVDEVLGF
jgi:hypothetical protein